MDAFIYALVLSPALTELLPKSGLSGAPSNVAFCGSVLFCDGGMDVVAGHHAVHDVPVAVVYAVVVLVERVLDQREVVVVVADVRERVRRTRGAGECGAVDGGDALLSDRPIAEPLFTHERTLPSDE